MKFVTSTNSDQYERMTITSAGNVELGTAQYVKNGEFFLMYKPDNAEDLRFKAPCDCSIRVHATMYIINHVQDGSNNWLEIYFDDQGTQYTAYNNTGTENNTYIHKTSNQRSFDEGDIVKVKIQNAYGTSYGGRFTGVLEITPN